MKTLRQFISEIINKKENSIPVDYDFITNKLFNWDDLLVDFRSWKDVTYNYDKNHNPETILKKFFKDKVTGNTMKVYIMPGGMNYLKPCGVKANQVNIVSKSKYEALIKQFNWESLIHAHYDWKVDVSEDNNAIRYYYIDARYDDGRKEVSFLEDVDYLIIFEQ